METTWGQGRISLSKMGETQACSWAEGKEPWERSEIRREWWQPMALVQGEARGTVQWVGSSQRSRDSSPSETTVWSGQLGQAGSLQVHMVPFWKLEKAVPTQWMKRERLGKCFRKSRPDRISTPRHPLSHMPSCITHTTQLHSGPTGRALAGSEKCHLHGRVRGSHVWEKSLAITAALQHSPFLVLRWHWYPKKEKLFPDQTNRTQMSLFQRCLEQHYLYE